VDHKFFLKCCEGYALETSGGTLISAMMWTSPLSWLGLAASFPIGLRLVRLFDLLIWFGSCGSGAVRHYS